MPYFWKRYYHAEMVVNLVENLMNNDYGLLRKVVDAIEIRAFNHNKINGFFLIIRPKDEFGGFLLEKERVIHIWEHREEIKITFSTNRELSEIPDKDIKCSMPFPHYRYRDAANYVIGKICEALEVVQ